MKKLIFSVFTVTTFSILMSACGQKPLDANQKAILKEALIGYTSASQVTTDAGVHTHVTTDSSDSSSSSFRTTGLFTTATVSDDQKRASEMVQKAITEKKCTVSKSRSSVKISGPACPISASSEISQGSSSQSKKISLNLSITDPEIQKWVDVTQISANGDVEGSSSNDQRTINLKMSVQINFDSIKHGSVSSDSTITLDIHAKESGDSEKVDVEAFGNWKSSYNFKKHGFTANLEVKLNGKADQTEYFLNGEKLTKSEISDLVGSSPRFAF